ncbi:integrator complex subunit 10 isoform X2 [Hetaerina americana]|uniref:integrator complex subunit 10 isoform X2 n=1 Tax=Hetaerina americana TaxID=62018 RepID=UPI003A7F2F43
MPVQVKQLSDEEYLVLRAKNALKSNPYEAKAWMLTAKTLFSDNFGVQFEAYNIEKSAKSVKESAKCFSAIFQKFQDEPELWKEVQAVTTSLRTESGDAEAVFLRQMFSHIPSNIQHQLLLVSADRSEDNMEHCRLLLLLLRRFPQTVAQHGPKLVDTLMTAEKHSHYQNSVNCYRKLLVCDLLPLLGSSSVELPVKQLFRLLQKSIEFYLCYLMSPKKSIQDLPEFESQIDDPWRHLFLIQEVTGIKLGWDLSGLFSSTMNKENYWQNLYNFFRWRPLGNEDSANHKQLLYCTTTFFLHCLYEYVFMVDRANVQPYHHNHGAGMSAAGGDTTLVLVEAFCAPEEVTSSSAEPKLKRRRTEDESGGPLITVGHHILKSSTQDGSGMPSAAPIGSASVPQLPSTASSSTSSNSSSVLSQNFLMAVRCWDLLHSSDSLEKEFVKLSQHLKVDSWPWFQGFLVDMMLYKGQFEEALAKIHQSQDGSFRKNLRLASTYFCLDKFNVACEHVLQVVASLPVATASPLVGLPTSPPPSNSLLKQPLALGRRHLHFLPLSRPEVLNYCVKLLLTSFQKQCKSPGGETDMVLGHMLVLSQLGWPQDGEEDALVWALERVRLRGSLSYPLFTQYIINVDILEEMVYLSTEHGGSIHLDILQPSTTTPPSTQRRMSTRGVDKGAKEDFKMAMRRQVARSNEPLDALMIHFLTNEKDLLLQTLM